MATLAELATLHARGTNETEALFDKVRAAVLITAETINNELDTVPNHVARVAWAKRAFTDPRTCASEMWGALIGANSGNTTTQIINASDAAIQNAVNNAVDIFLEV